MRDLVMLFVHLIATVVKLLRPGGARAVVAESLLLKHQLLILNRARARAPNLRPIDRVIAGLCAGLMRPCRLLRARTWTSPRSPASSMLRTFLRAACASRVTRCESLHSLCGPPTAHICGRRHTTDR